LGITPICFKIRFGGLNFGSRRVVLSGKNLHLK